MGRAHMAFCGEQERERRMARIRNDAGEPLSEQEKRAFRTILDRARMDGFAVRNPRTPPFRTTTIGMPLCEKGEVRALVSLSVYRSSARVSDLREKVIEPLKATIAKIEAALAFMDKGGVET